MRLITLICAYLGIICLFSSPAQEIKPQHTWYDTAGQPINAHGGGVMYHNGTYYWYGEYKGRFTYRSPGVGWECYRTDFNGVSCYSSTDLKRWTFEGVVLQPDSSNVQSSIHPTMVVERPKVIYNDKTGKFVMWMHIDNPQYNRAAVGVAVSDSPSGPFTFIGDARPHQSESRDMTIFKDDDHTAYLLYSSEGNSTLHISRLSDDYLQVSDTYTRQFAGLSREAPAVFKHNGLYYIITSGCSGWDPNEAQYAVGKSMSDDFVSLHNPCKGKDADKTFYSQSTFVIPIAGKPGKFIAMFDTWKKDELRNSTYTWLPIEFHGNDIIINWHDSWSLDDYISK